MTEFSGTDPDRILPLLWRHRSPAKGRTGRPPRLTVDAVVVAGLAIADAEGLEAASMARVAARLEVATMTLYTYVPSRAYLVELMVDEVLAGRRLPGPGDARPSGWREQIQLYADRTITMYREHPWLTEVSRVRPPLGPGMLRESEYVLSTLGGVPVERRNTAAVTITMFVTAAARQEGENAQLRRTDGQSNDAWWSERGQLWEDWFDVEQHPAMTELWNAGGFDRGPDQQAVDAFAYGLRLLLDGIEAQSSDTTGLRSSPMP
ncbi:TetR/AcrR family transcriptional regulator [Actinoplanes friuliensis]|uniref:TetR family transcriptional regulator n=1 Tax=Actinoplanes friuliensis DSM 7358 TaxID=1246995 RepID=U5W900_9ACTN|nr:TetR/AcrR family transcriptional regulator C-terminal domain-containing protein [Actinoplanes friuliensis]AGZ45599.1 TetR family transcriptional regulator [Actinoplanes friuliensis DSM 7358]